MPGKATPPIVAVRQARVSHGQLSSHTQNVLCVFIFTGIILTVEMSASVQLQSGRENVPKPPPDLLSGISASIEMNTVWIQ